MFWIAHPITGSFVGQADERPLVRLLAANEVLATIFGDGRFVTARGEFQHAKANLVPLRTKLRRLQKVTQAGIESQVARSGVVPASSDGRDPLRYAIELRTPKGQIRVLQIWSPRDFRNKRLSQVDTFLSALDALAEFAELELDI